MKIEIERDTVQQALDALDNHPGNYTLTDAECDIQESAISALREALAAQPAYERVGTLYSLNGCGWRFALNGLKCLGFAVETPVFKLVEKSS